VVCTAFSGVLERAAITGLAEAILSRYDSFPCGYKEIGDTIVPEADDMGVTQCSD
jgi:hypothetical protein